MAALGFVKDAAAEMATWTAMIVPIRFGGGTRVKISEAFVRRIPVVATHLGAFGYDAVDDEQILPLPTSRALSTARGSTNALLRLARRRSAVHAVPCMPPSTGPSRAQNRRREWLGISLRAVRATATP
jgi:hypothetical protein